ncbi:hypothetical protein MA13_contig00005-0192 [Edwardsiella piscicida]|nr:hypothetical protein MA13_contig00005-0192 [Edwardsiella piscicida]
MFTLWAPSERSGSYNRVFHSLFCQEWADGEQAQWYEAMHVWQSITLPSTPEKSTHFWQLTTQKRHRRENRQD